MDLLSQFGKKRVVQQFCWSRKVSGSGVYKAGVHHDIISLWNLVMHEYTEKAIYIS